MGHTLLHFRSEDPAAQCFAQIGKLWVVGLGGDTGLVLRSLKYVLIAGNLKNKCRDVNRRVCHFITQIRLSVFLVSFLPFFLIDLYS